MLTCRDVTSLATDAMERSLPWRVRLRVRLHLVMCWMCRRYLRQLDLTRRVLPRLSGPERRARIPDPLREAFRQSLNEKHR